MVFWVFGYGSLVWNPGFDYDEKMIGCIKNYRRVFDLACIDHRGTPEHPARTCTLEYKEGAICWGTVYCVRGDEEKERLAMAVRMIADKLICQATSRIYYISPAGRVGFDPNIRLSWLMAKARYLKSGLWVAKLENPVYGLACHKLVPVWRLLACYLENRECEYDEKTSVDFFKEGDIDGPTLTGVMVFTSTPDKENNKYYLGPAPLEDMARQIATAFGPCGNNRDYVFLLEKAMFDIGHEDDMVIELANEVRKVLGITGLGVLKENGSSRLTGSSHKPKSPMSPHKLIRLPEAIAMDT